MRYEVGGVCVYTIPVPGGMGCVVYLCLVGWGVWYTRAWWGGGYGVPGVGGVVYLCLVGGVVYLCLVGWGVWCTWGGGCGVPVTGGVGGV